MRGAKRLTYFLRIKKLAKLIIDVPGRLFQQYVCLWHNFVYAWLFFLSYNIKNIYIYRLLQRISYNMLSAYGRSYKIVSAYGRSYKMLTVLSVGHGYEFQFYSVDSQHQCVYCNSEQITKQFQEFLTIVNTCCLRTSKQGAFFDISLDFLGTFVL